MKAIYLSLLILFVSCADKKNIAINNEVVIVEPYGWFDLEAKNDSVRYRVCVGNIVLSIILVETIIAPVFLTGYELYEPVEKIKK